MGSTLIIILLLGNVRGCETAQPLSTVLLCLFQALRQAHVIPSLYLYWKKTVISGGPGDLGDKSAFNFAAFSALQGQVHGKYTGGT